VIVAREYQNAKQHFIICKGAAESILPLCRMDEERRKEVDTKAQRYAEQGYYVIAFGSRSVGDEEARELADFSDRDRVEEADSFSFLGFLLFRNELRPDSRATLVSLTKAAVRSIMITGDNVYCGLYIAYQAELIEQSQQVMLGRMSPDGCHVEWQQAVWRSAEAVRIEPEITTTEDLLGLLLEHDQPTRLAMTGKVYKYLATSLQADELDIVLRHLAVCARARPDVKSTIVETLMKEHIVGMVGDGGNDAPALVSQF